MNLLGLDNPPRASAKQGEQGDPVNHQSYLRNLEGRANRLGSKDDQKIKMPACGIACSLRRGYAAQKENGGMGGMFWCAARRKCLHPMNTLPQSTCNMPVKPGPS